MTANKGQFINLDESISLQVRLGYGKLYDIVGKRVIFVQTKGGNSKLMYDVFYVLGLTQNLLSISQLVMKGHKVIFEGSDCLIFDKIKN